MYGPDYGAHPIGREMRMVPATPRSISPAQQYRQAPRSFPQGEHRGRGSSMGDFDVQYMGSVPLGPGHHQGSEPSMEDVARVVSFLRERTQAFRMEGTRLKSYVIRISSENVSFVQLESRDVQHIPINMINFVAADPLYPTIVSLVARGKGNRFMCHVFECRSPTQCNAITKTVSLAFRVSYESWLRVEENQRRQEERLEQDMGGLDYFQEWDDHAPRGMPLYNISGYYNSGRPRPRQFIKPRDEMPMPREDTSLPDRLIVTRNQPAARQEFEPEPYTLRFNFDEDDYEAQDEVYVRQDLYNGRRQSMQRQGQYWD